jgi:hypothetical protein
MSALPLAVRDDNMLKHGEDGEAHRCFRLGPRDQPCALFLGDVVLVLPQHGHLAGRQYRRRGIEQALQGHLS